MLYKVVNDDEEGVQKDNIQVTSTNILTIHQSKGLEFDVVILIDAVHKMTNRNPSEQLLSI